MKNCEKMAPAKNPNLTKDSTAKEQRTVQSQQQQQQQQKQREQQQRQGRTYTANGETARRTPQGLNDCLLPAVAPITTGTVNSSTLRNQNYNSNNNIHQQQQPQSSAVNGVEACALEYDLATLHENQGFCYSPHTVQTRHDPRQQQQQQQPLAYQLQQQEQNESEEEFIFAQLQQILGDPLRATTKGHTTTAPPQRKTHNLLPVNLLDLATSLAGPSANATAYTNLPVTNITTAANVESFLLQRIQLIKHFLQLTAKANNSNQCVAPTLSATANTSNGAGTSNSAQSVNKKLENPLLKHGINTTTMERDVVVNSTSLEDVALSEMSDNRAQSIQSLHSVETPTPDTTPSYDELQQRLEASNRNIQNMQEQQQQLLRLQNAAKQHLSDMEQLRSQAGNLSFGPGQKNANGAPDYESIEQVHGDMATLVGRMKNLTAFIQGQNELSSLLGEDGPEILAEQEALQQKLESLRTQRDEMRHLVGELQDINRSAEQSAQALRNGDRPQERHTQRLEGGEESNQEAQKEMPKSYSRNVPIQLTNGMAPAETEAPESAATALLIQQKVADIETMRAQLKRLKDMMETVNMIEARTERDPADIGRTPPREIRSQSASTVVSNDRERTPIALESLSGGNDDNDGFISRKMRMLNEVTSDLRAQAESLQAERDRIKALKEEIVRRKEQAAAAAQLGEDALKRSSLTPTPTPRSRQREDNSPPSPPQSVERDQLKEEYKAKKKEFELLCQRLQQDDMSAGNTQTFRNDQRRRDTVSEADDEADAEEELNDSDFIASAATNSRKFYSTPQRPTPVVQSINNPEPTNNAQLLHNGKESLDSTMSSANAAADTARATTLLNSTQDGGSIEACSVQSGSSQSYSMPPAMPAMSACSSWPPMPPIPSTWNPPLYYGFGLPVPPPPLSQSAQTTATATQAAGVTGGTSFTPSSFTSLQSGTVPAAATAAAQTQPAAGQHSGSECICSTTNSAATIGAGSGTATSTTSTAAQLAADPVLLQQFVQTQQMLINSVCQCNQMLWHQQREIDALNNTIHILQERIFALTGGLPTGTEVPFGCRAESVPPPTMSGALPNNLFPSGNRAQSEQPALFLPGGMHARSAFTNFHQQQQFQQRQRGIIAANAGGYNYNSETQQQNAASTNTSIYATLNNAVPPPQAASAPQYNNEAPQSPMTGAGPGPIFMHHHNNAIHQNNANLRTQNHYANNLHQQQQQQQHSNVNGGGNTLNNQVPPGNRANNYWDNFRSYSRQNLLSTNSNKSNEEQQNQNQQQQQQRLHLYHEQQQQHQQRMHEQHIRYQQHRLSQQQQRPTAALTATNLEQLQQQHQQQQQLPPRPQLYQSTAGVNSSNNCNNLNYDRNAACNSKYMRALQRSRINQYQQQQQQQQQQNISSNIHLRNCNNLYQPMREFLGNLNWHETSAVTETDTVVDNPYESYNIVDSDLTATYTPATSSNLRNMNVNFGNSPHYQRNKVLAKPTCRVNSATTTPLNLNRLQQQQQHLRNVDVDFVTDTQQRQPQSLRNITYASATQQERFLELVPASASVETPQNHLQNRERIDLLLRTVTADVDEDDEYAYGAPVTSGSQVNENSAASGFALGGNDSTNNNDDDEDDDDDDTTSEEIKRNLLVNALKNDKFTTKFYESIKEDVFRRLESMLLEKESSNSRRGEQLCNDVSTPMASASGGGGDGVNNGNLRDPMRKLYLNACMGNQQQRQKQSCAAAQQLEQSVKLEVKEHVVENVVNNVYEEETEEVNNAETESNNADNDGPYEHAAETIENEKPEDENERYNNVPEAENVADSNWRENSNNNGPQVKLDTSSTNVSGKKRKNQQKIIESVGDNDGARSLQLQDAIQAQGITNTTITDLINFIITYIRNQTHSNTLISDALLVDVAKLTANAAAGGHLATTSVHISPKKIYAKIKKLSIPRQRDEFLSWYQKYLETLFSPMGQEQNTESTQQQTQQKNNISPKPQTHTNGVTETVNNQSSNNNNNTRKNNSEVNDADLAEADQNSANTSSNTSNHLLQQEISNTTQQDTGDDMRVTATAGQEHDFENNENPDDESTGGAESGACALLPKEQSNFDSDAAADNEQEGNTLSSNGNNDSSTQSAELAQHNSFA